MIEPAAVLLYAATHEGIFVLRARGDGVAAVAEACPGAIVECIKPRPHHPETLFAGVTHDGLYRTRDAGRHWQRVLAGDIRAIAVDPVDDRIIYAGTEPVHLHRSEDAGDTWHEITSLQRLPEDTSAKQGKPRAAADDFNRSSFRHGRQEWTFPLPPHQGHITEIFIRPEQADEIWLSIEHGGIARSGDRGASWEDASDGIDYLDIHKLLRLPGPADRYVVSSARGLYQAADPRAGWHRAEHGIARNYFHDMLALPPSAGGTPPLLVCCADQSPGFWEATRETQSWAHGKRGASAALYRSDDGAQSWRRLGAGRGLPDEMEAMMWSLDRHPVASDAIFAGTGEVGRGYAFGTAGAGAILRSDDQGESWRTLRSGLPALRQLAVVAD